MTVFDGPAVKAGEARQALVAAGFTPVAVQFEARGPWATVTIEGKHPAAEEHVRDHGFAAVRS